MKLRRIVIVVVVALLLVGTITLLSTICEKQSLPQSSQKNDSGSVTVKDVNNDGKMDNWLYADKENTPLRWIRDSDFDGVPDQWSYFKDGKAFIDQHDLDQNGKVDAIYLNIWTEDRKMTRGFSFRLEDVEHNIFVEHEDTGWKDRTKEQDSKENR